MILDSGALIAVDRNDRKMIARLVVAYQNDDEVKTHPMVVAQVWRDGRGRQAQLAGALRGIDVVPIDADLGKRCGELLGTAGSSDPIDAAVVLIARDGDTILTSDDDDIRRLAAAAGRRVAVVHC